MVQRFSIKPTLGWRDNNDKTWRRFFKFFTQFGKKRQDVFNDFNGFDGNEEESKPMGKF